MGRLKRAAGLGRRLIRGARPAARARGWRWRCAAIVLVALVAGTGCREHQAQRAMARSLLPRELRPQPRTGRRSGPVQVARVRIYADQEFRTQTMRWQRKLAAQIDRANELLIPEFGVELRIDAVRPWQRQASSEEMSAMLSELAALDPAADVPWVIGVVTALPRLTTSMRDLGRSYSPGRHIVVRAVNDVAEHRAISRLFADLDQVERDNLFEARKQHQETVVLLHELTHSLGAVHDRVPHSLMNATYSRQIGGFTAAARRLVAALLPHRLALAGPAREAEALLHHHDNHPWNGWLADELASNRDTARRLVEQGPGAQAPDRAPLELRPVDQRRFTDAVRLGERGDVERAWLELEELLQFYPEQPQVQLFGCTLAQRRHGDTPASRALCARAAALAPADPEPHLAVAESALKAGDRARAQASLLQARSRLGASSNASTAAQPARAALWARAAQLFRQLGQVSRTEEALAQAGAGPELDELRRWAAETRARYGLPPGGARHGIPPESEAEYVEVVQGLLRSIYASRFAEAEAALRRADRRFPRAPGILAARCDLEMRRARYEQAEASCRAALRVYEGASWAHFLLAANLARKGTVAPAIEHYRRAIALDGRLEAAWAMLAQLYRKSGDAAALGELERAYTAAFGRTLPR